MTPTKPSLHQVSFKVLTFQHQQQPSLVQRYSRLKGKCFHNPACCRTRTRQILNWATEAFYRCKQETPRPQAKASSIPENWRGTRSLKTRTAQYTRLCSFESASGCVLGLGLGHGWVSVGFYGRLRSKRESRDLRHGGDGTNSCTACVFPVLCFEGLPNKMYNLTREKSMFRDLGI